ncbi:MAG: hypothetical protein FWH04_08845, partial [Oscillospiraceae bacterium]|nr:hypothetical protein [Oscillospiraceae bacterium]
FFLDPPGSLGATLLYSFLLHFNYTKHSFGLISKRPYLFTTPLSVTGNRQMAVGSTAPRESHPSAILPSDPHCLRRLTDGKVRFNARAVARSEYPLLPGRGQRWEPPGVSGLTFPSADGLSVKKKVFDDWVIQFVRSAAPVGAALFPKRIPTPSLLYWEVKSQTSTKNF